MSHQKYVFSLIYGKNGTQIGLAKQSLKGQVAEIIGSTLLNNSSRASRFPLLERAYASLYPVANRLLGVAMAETRDEIRINAPKEVIDNFKWGDG